MISKAMDEQRRLELWATLAIRHTKGIGARKSHSLLERYGSAYAAVEAQKLSPSAWRDIISEKICLTFASESWRNPALEEWRSIQKSGVSFLLYSDPDYPKLLKETCDAPLLLYVRGDISLLHNPMIGVVGSRNCTQQGIRMCVLLAQALSEAGITVVSGMARGIDRAAHLAGLSGAGSSIAVLGTGLDVVYPPTNSDLAMQLANTGLLISEFSPETTALSRHFPIRNRIISGLSLGLLVIEASERSGSLITARLALEQNRDVFAVPGNMTAPVSEGCRDLIRKGAKPVFSIDDIFTDLVPRLTADIRERVEKLPKINNETMLAQLTSSNLLSDLPLPLVATKRGVCQKSRARGAIKKDSFIKHEDIIEKKADQPNAASVIELLELSPKERVIVEILQHDNIHIDELSRTLSLAVGPLSSLLATMEIKGIIKRMPGMVYGLL